MTSGLTRGRWTRRWGALLLAMLICAVGAASAGAAARWSVTFDEHTNTYIKPGLAVTYFVTVANVGTTATGSGSANAYQLGLTMPSGMTVASFAAGTVQGWSCSGVGTAALTCTRSNNVPVNAAAPRIRVTGLLDAGAQPGVLAPVVAEIAGGGSGANVPVMSDGVTPCGFAGSVPTPYQPICTTATSKSVIVDPDPPFGIRAFDGSISANALDDPFTQAGGHPYELRTDILLDTDTHPLYGPSWPVEPMRTVRLDTPPGLVGDPRGVEQCSLADLNPVLGTIHPVFGQIKSQLCPAESQIGVADVLMAQGDVNDSPPFTFESVPVFNMEAPAGVPARFAMRVVSTVIAMDFTLRSGEDYGLTLNIADAPEGVAVIGTTVRLWGFPADSTHDPSRYCPNIESPGCASTADPTAPLLRNPTRCTAPGVGLVTTLHMDSWFHTGDFVTRSFESHLPPGFPLSPDQWGDPQGPTGCDLVPFAASLTAVPADAKANTPSAFAFDVTIPQEDVGGIAPSDLKRAVVTLPDGVRISPSAAHGLQACTEAQVGLGHANASACPPGSKVGTLTIETPLLEESMEGSIYLAKPHDNPFGSLVAIYLVARGPGLVVKLPGRVQLDPTSGRITTVFDDNPQLPFEHLHLEFHGGARSQLVTPPTCGIYATQSEFTGWSGKVLTSESDFTVTAGPDGKPCPPKRRFVPSFVAGGESTKAGGDTTFGMSLSRDDQDQEFSGLELELPEGLLADLSDVPLCSEDRAKAGTCGAESLVGEVTTAAGAGQSPFFLDGKVYLTGPYNGGPFGFSIVVPAIAGPFDLGDVVVRASIQVDRTTAQVRVVSDPLPRILEGIPLQVRIVRVTVDRPDFMVNPTSCQVKQVRGTIESTAGDTADVSSRFRVGDCAGLRLAPRMSMRVGGKGRTHQNASTPFVTKLTQTPGQSNLKSVKVVLPTVLNARLAVVEDACTLAEFRANDCAKARTGTAVAVTPLLKEPLRGGVFFVENPDRPLPDLMVALRGQVDFDLVGRVTIPGGKRLATTFDAVPDVPIKSFSLRLFSGRNGAVGVARNLCSRSNKRRAVASVVFTGQNGRILRGHKRIKIAGCAKPKRTKR